MLCLFLHEKYYYYSTKVQDQSGILTNIFLLGDFLRWLLEIDNFCTRRTLEVLMIRRGRGIEKGER